MGRPGLRQEQVSAAAARIADAEGRAAVTLRRVRKELGRGSLRTIHRMLAVWREEPADVCHRVTVLSVSLSPTDKATLDRAVHGSGLTQQEWLAGAVGSAINAFKDAPDIGDSQSGLSPAREPVAQGFEDLTISSTRRFEENSREDWHASIKRPGHDQ